MANGNFIVHNGLTVGALSIDATSGNITTSGTLSSTSILPTSISGVVTLANTATSVGTTTGALIVSGGVGIAGNVWVGGNLYVANIINQSSSVLVVNEPLVYLTGDTPATYNYEIGLYSHFGNPAVSYPTANYYQHTGLVRDHNDSTWKFFSNVAEPTSSTVSLTNAVYDGIKVGSITTTGDVLPSANVTYNIGSTSAWWGTVYGLATQAKYADLAENYMADDIYSPGTVLEFGGEQEVTLGTIDSKRVAGVVSTNPAHLMNGALTGTNVAAIALQGRVPCNVIGPVAKGDLMVSAGFGYAKSNNNAQVGQVIGKSLVNFGGGKGQIEVVVGRV